jgi:nicotinamidase-related amidase
MHRPSALLVVDMQYGFMSNGADRLVPVISDLVSMYPPEKVYYLRYRNHPGSLFTRYLNWHEFMTSDQSGIVPEVYRAGSRVFDHFGYSPPPEMLDTLKVDGLTEIGICGVDTDACVMAALFCLWDHDIRPIVLSSYCFSSGGENLHRAALDMMLRQFGLGSVFPKRFAA